MPMRKDTIKLFMLCGIFLMISTDYLRDYLPHNLRVSIFVLLWILVFALFIKLLQAKR